MSVVGTHDPPGPLRRSGGALSRALLEDVEEALRQHGVVVWLDKDGRAAFLANHPTEATELRDKELKRRSKKTVPSFRGAH